MAGTALIELALGGGLIGVLAPLEGRLRVRDGFVLVAFTWCLMGVIGAVPLMLSLDLSFGDALFEAISGLTTTGATILSGLDDMPRSVLLYRQELQWVGGIGVVVSAIALFPMLGIGGMQLLKPEIPGPIKTEKLRPRLRETTRLILGIYLLVTLACATAYWAGGMSLYDAVAHSLSTVSTGGFSTHDASLAYFDNPLIEGFAMFFMVVASINFSLHYVALHQLRLRPYLENSEVRAFFGVIAVVWIAVAVTLYGQAVFSEPSEALRHAGFQVVSVLTSTGFSTRDFNAWPLFVPILLIFISFIGGCAGSTAGGMKVLRFVILGKQAAIEIRRLYHPRLVQQVRLGRDIVPPDIIQSIWAYCAIYVTVFAVTMVILMFDGMDAISAFGAVATCLNNLGPGLGDVGQTFATTSSPERWLLSLAMLLGRLELFTLFVLFMPSFWKE